MYAREFQELRDSIGDITQLIDLEEQSNNDKEVAQLNLRLAELYTQYAELCEKKYITSHEYFDIYGALTAFEEAQRILNRFNVTPSTLFIFALLAIKDKVAFHKSDKSKTYFEGVKECSNRTPMEVERPEPSEKDAVDHSERDAEHPAKRQRKLARSSDDIEMPDADDNSDDMSEDKENNDQLTFHF